MGILTDPISVMVLSGAAAAAFLYGIFSLVYIAEDWGIIR